MTAKTTAELRAELRAAELRESAERQARTAQTPVVRKFTIEPTKPKGRFHDDLFDPSCRFYDLECEITNRAEALEAGHAEHDLRSGGMTYVFNTLSGLIVCAVGGGSIYVSGGWDAKNAESAQLTMGAISAFIVANPEGGDITDLVEVHRNAAGTK